MPCSLLAPQTLPLRDSARTWLRAGVGKKENSPEWLQKSTWETKTVPQCYSASSSGCSPDPKDPAHVRLRPCCPHPRHVGKQKSHHTAHFGSTLSPTACWRLQEEPARCLRAPAEPGFVSGVLLSCASAPLLQPKRCSSTKPLSPATLRHIGDGNATVPPQLEPVASIQALSPASEALAAGGLS